MNGEPYKIQEGRQFLTLITKISGRRIDAMPAYAIEAWLNEMGYKWNDDGWVRDGNDNCESGYCHS